MNQFLFLENIMNNIDEIIEDKNGSECGNEVMWRKNV